MANNDFPNPPRPAGAPAPSAASPQRGRVTATLAETGRLTGISRSELYRLLAQGKPRAIKANSRTLIVWDSVLDYLSDLPAATFRSPSP